MRGCLPCLLRLLLIVGFEPLGATDDFPTSLVCSLGIEGLPGAPAVPAADCGLLAAGSHRRLPYCTGMRLLSLPSLSRLLCLLLIVGFEPLGAPDDFPTAQVCGC